MKRSSILIVLVALVGVSSTRGAEFTVYYDEAEFLQAIDVDTLNLADPDGDPLTFEWSVSSGTAVLEDVNDPQTQGLFPVGQHLLTLTVTDGNGGVGIDDVLITVEDTTAPTLLLTTDKIVLWPPRHQMVPVEITLVVSMECTSPLDLILNCQITSNEPDDGSGHCSFPGDVDLLDGQGGQDAYVAPLPFEFTYDSDRNVFVTTVALRAERDGHGRGRTYSISCDVLDAQGNLSTTDCVVIVPHGRRCRR